MLHGRASSIQPVRLYPLANIDGFLTIASSNLFICALFEDTPFLVDITNPKPVKRVLPSKPLLDDSLSSTDGSHTTCAAIWSLHGNHILTGTNRGYINIIETETRTIIHSTKIGSGLITLLRLSSNGRSLLVNSTDRIIRVIQLPDLTQIRPSNAMPTDDEEIDPSTLAENIGLSVEHKFQDLVNRLRWNHTTFSHSSSNSSSDYVTASTYMKKDIYIWELSTNSLLRILENSVEPASIEWHPSRPLIAATGVETGSIQIWGIEPQQKWSALAPDFAEVEENVEYIEREDEFDEFPEEERTKRRLDREDEEVDIFTIEPTKEDEEPSFVLPVIIGVDQETDDDDELVPMGVGTMRKKEANEGREWEDSAEPVPVARRRAR
jgi:COMPASS component SWD1